MKKLLWHHYVSARDIDYEWFIGHCQMIAFIINNHKAGITWAQYVNEAKGLGIEHINEEYFTKYMGWQG